MKAFIFRLLSILFFTSFCFMLLWHYLTYSQASLHGPHNAQENPNRVADISHQNAQNSDAALSSPRNVKKTNVKKKNAVSSIIRIIKKIHAKNNGAANSNPRKVKQNPANINDAADSDPRKVMQNPAKMMQPPAIHAKLKKNPSNSNENEIIDSLLAHYNSNRKKQESDVKSFRAFLNKNCNAIANATVTQDNSPVGTKFIYDGDKKKTMEVTPALFQLFPKENPFKNASWDSCAVVGNGGILANSSCGKQIDSATFVIRCNLPPLNNERDTGSKTNLVTANPSILVEKYHSLTEQRRTFVNDMQVYKDALLFLPAFSFRRNTPLSLRVLYSLEDFNNHGPQPVFFNPGYLNSLAKVWHDQGIHSLRLSTGIMMASLALELCNNVHLYGFWPFGTHPYTHKQLTNHYYDNRSVNKRMHAMPDEFKALLNLHNKGVIHLHLGECTN